MIFSKIKKHLFIILIRLKQKKELIKISKENNQILTNIIQAFFQLRANKVSDSDSQLFNKCEDYRNSLLKNKRFISYAVFGDNKKVLVQDICKQASLKPIWAQFLFLIIKQIKSPNVLEIGTNLGVSGSYIIESLKNKKNSRFITMEGVPGLCKIANEQFEKISKTGKHEIREGLYEKTFPQIILENKCFNIFFIDGNHRKESTLQYFNNLKQIIKRPSIMIFDDINWSDEMSSAWQIIKKDAKVSYSLDFFKLGIIIIAEFKMKKQKHFQLHLHY